jgi:leucyl aminopeptidase
VCFDTGGLDIKPERMLNMKKDMGGAACMLALAHADGSGHQIRLRVVIPAVENAISGSRFRPRDVYARARASLWRSAIPTRRAA